VKAPDRSTARDSLRSSVRRADKPARLPCGAYVVGGRSSGRPLSVPPDSVKTQATPVDGEGARNCGGLRGRRHPWSQTNLCSRLAGPAVKHGSEFGRVGGATQTTGRTQIPISARTPVSGPDAGRRHRYQLLYGRLTNRRPLWDRTNDPLYCTRNPPRRCIPHYVTRTSLTANIRQARSHARSLSSDWCPCGRRGECPCFLRLDAAARRAIAVADSLRTRPAGTVHRSPTEGPP
jgi:hypothetical protein